MRHCFLCNNLYTKTNKKKKPQTPPPPPPPKKKQKQKNKKKNKQKTTTKKKKKTTKKHTLFIFIRTVLAKHSLTYVLGTHQSDITKTCLFKYIENFTSKNIKFSDKKILILFHSSAQNIDCGYSLEPPRGGSSNEYPHSMFLSNNKKNNAYPCKPQFYYIKVGFKGV